MDFADKLVLSFTKKHPYKRTVFESGNYIKPQEDFLCLWDKHFQSFQTITSCIA